MFHIMSIYYTVIIPLEGVEYYHVKTYIFGCFVILEIVTF